MPEEKATFRDNIFHGLEVDIVLKKDQPTGKLTRGIVKQILTNSKEHHRGIKVMLEDGQVGRVQKIVSTVAELDLEKQNDFDMSADFFIVRNLTKANGSYRFRLKAKKPNTPIQILFENGTDRELEQEFRKLIFSKPGG